MTQKMNKFNSLKKTTKVDFATYFGVIAAFVIVTVLQSNGSLKRSAIGLLVPICCYMSMAVSLNLTVGILGELSLGHAGFMSVGAFSGIVASQSLMGAIPNAPVRLAISMVVGAIFAAIVGLLIGTPVLRLQGDYLAIVTLAFGEIIKELINCLIIGYDENGLHFIFNPAGNKTRRRPRPECLGHRYHQGRAGCDRHRHDRNVHRGLHPRDDYAHRRAEPELVRVRAARSWPSATTASPRRPSA